MKKLLVEEAKRQLVPAVRDLGFRDCYPAARIQVPEKAPRYTNRYVRLRDGSVEVLSLEWRRYGLPFFVLCFDRVPITEGSELRSLIEGAMLAPAYRALLSRVPFQFWFGPGWVGCILAPRHEARTCIAKAVSRLQDIDRFLRTGDRSGYLRGPFRVTYKSDRLGGIE